MGDIEDDCFLNSSQRPFSFKYNNWLIRIIPAKFLKQIQLMHLNFIQIFKKF